MPNTVIHKKVEGTSRHLIPTEIISKMCGTALWPRVKIEAIIIEWNKGTSIKEMAHKFEYREKQVYNKIKTMLRQVGVRREPAKDGVHNKPGPDVSKQKWRKCLKCLEMFLSYGPQNRICDNCKNRVNNARSALAT